MDALEYLATIEMSACLPISLADSSLIPKVPDSD